MAILGASFGVVAFEIVKVVNKYIKVYCLQCNDVDALL
jgi:hypothetical protein